MIIIRGQAFAKIEINGNDVSNTPNFLEDVTICEGEGALVPTCSVTVNDFTSLFSRDRNTTDGTKFTFTLGEDQADAGMQTFGFRLFANGGPQGSSGPQITPVGLLDTHDYVTASMREAYKGTSSDVLKAISSKCGFTYDGPENFNGRQMADSQTWINMCKSRAVFVRDVVKHAHMDSKSGMSFALTCDRKLKMRNLIDVINTPMDKIKFQILHNHAQPNSDSRQAYFVREASSMSSSGLSNSFVNYGSTRIVNSLSGEHSAIDSLSVQTKGILQINKDIHTQVENARFEYAPIDCGNAHDNYEDAMFQNVKVTALFSEAVAVLIDKVTQVELFDPVIYRQADADLTKPVNNTDIYIVTGRTRRLKGATYYSEMLILRRMSVRMAGDTNLVLPNSDLATQKTLIPDVSINPTINSARTTLPGSATISSVTSQMNSISTAVSASAAQMGDSVGAAFSSIKTANAQIATIEQNISQGKEYVEQSLATALAPVLDPLKTTIADMQEYGTLLTKAVSTAQTTVKTIITYPAAVRNSALSQVNGVISTSIGGVFNSNLLRSFGVGTSALNSRVNTLLSKVDSVGNTQTQQLNQLASQASTTIGQVSGTSVGGWNTGAGSLQGLLYSGSSSNVGYQTAQNISKAISGNNSMTATNTALTNEIAKVVGTQPNYTSPEAMSAATPTVDNWQASLQQQLSLVYRG